MIGTPKRFPGCDDEVVGVVKGATVVIRASSAQECGDEDALEEVADQEMPVWLLREKLRYKVPYLSHEVMDALGRLLAQCIPYRVVGECAAFGGWVNLLSAVGTAVGVTATAAEPFLDALVAKDVMAW